MLNRLFANALERARCAITGPKISREQAESYVREIEMKWGQEATVIRPSWLFFDHGLQVWRVETPSNKWDVWREPSGRIYGEC